MSVTYKNAPLVELIAELRWGIAADAAASDPMMATTAIPVPMAKMTDIASHLSDKMAQCGFGRSENLLPLGMPAFPFQVSVRYRPTDGKSPSPLFQFGNGIFTANALPPYKSWQEFSPAVQQGIECLFQAFDAASVQRPSFSYALVRYIDAFRDDLTGGRPALDFLNEVMGFRFVLPEAIKSHVTDGSEPIQTNMKFVIPTAVGRLEITTGDGNNGNDRATLFDTSLLIQREIGSDVGAAMAALTQGRQVIHDIFRGVTSKLHAAMEPTQ